MGLLGPFHGAIAIPCHALSLSSSSLLSWTSHAACAIAIAGVRLATSGDWQCNDGSHLANGPNIFQMLLVEYVFRFFCFLQKPSQLSYLIFTSQPFCTYYMLTFSLFKTRSWANLWGHQQQVQADWSSCGPSWTQRRSESGPTDHDPSVSEDTCHGSSSPCRHHIQTAAIIMHSIVSMYIHTQHTIIQRVTSALQTG